MPVPSFDLLPTFQEGTDFLLSTNQGCQSSCLSNVQPTVNATFSSNAVHIEQCAYLVEDIIEGHKCPSAVWGSPLPVSA